MVSMLTSIDIEIHKLLIMYIQLLHSVPLKCVKYRVAGSLVAVTLKFATAMHFVYSITFCFLHLAAAFENSPGLFVERTRAVLTSRLTYKNTKSPLQHSLD